MFFSATSIKHLEPDSTSAAPNKCIQANLPMAFN